VLYGWSNLYCFEWYNCREGPLPVSSSSRLNYTRTHWLLYKTRARVFPLLPRLEMRNAYLRHFGNPNFGISAVRNTDLWHFGASAAQNADYWYFGFPKCRSRTTGNITCKRIYHNIHTIIASLLSWLSVMLLLVFNFMPKVNILVII